MKKFLSAALAMTMLTGLFAFSASAAAPISDVSRMSTEQIAYLDIDRATPEVQKAILEARNEIIFGDQGWTVDGAVKIFNIKEGTVRELPEFSELFPGWDVPEASSCPIAKSAEGVMRNTADGECFNYAKNVSLKVANSYAAAPDFFDFNGVGHEVGAYASSGPRDFMYNIGFSNTSSGESLGWAPYLVKGEGAKIETDTVCHYGVRASACDTASKGQYRMHVTDDPSIIGTFEILP